MSWPLAANIRGPQGIPGIQGPQGNPGTQGIQGNPGPVQSLIVPFLRPSDVASAVATNLALNTVLAVGDPSYRFMADLRNLGRLKIVGRIGGSLVAATKIRLQYHPGGNINIATGDAGWATLGDTAGSHVLATLFETAEIAVPAGAQIQNCVIRAGLFSGDGVADPTITACVARFYF